MIRKSLLAAAGALLLNVGVTTSADAARCTYFAFNPWTNDVSSSIRGSAIGAGACRRAKRRCVRKLRSAWSNGQAQQFGCVKEGQAVQ